MMGISNQDLVFKLKSIGVRVEGDDAHIDTDIIKAILQGKKLPHPREVILRDEQAPPRPKPRAAARRPRRLPRRRARRPPANPLRPQRPRTLIQKVEPRIQNAADVRAPGAAAAGCRRPRPAHGPGRAAPPRCRRAPSCGRGDAGRGGRGAAGPRVEVQAPPLAPRSAARRAPAAARRLPAAAAAPGAPRPRRPAAAAPGSSAPPAPAARRRRAAGASQPPRRRSGRPSGPPSGPAPRARPGRRPAPGVRRPRAPASSRRTPRLSTEEQKRRAAERMQEQIERDKKKKGSQEARPALGGEENLDQLQGHPGGSRGGEDAASMSGRRRRRTQRKEGRGRRAASSSPSRRTSRGRGDDQRGHDPARVRREARRARRAT